MTASAPLAFPGSRTLAGWWRQFGSVQPRALWVAHLLLHRVEALVSLTRTQRPDPLHLLVLKAVSLQPEASLERLDATLFLGRQVLGRVLAVLQAEGLALDQPEGRWEPTALGRQALEQGSYPLTHYERRAFSFVQSTLPQRGPHYLNIDPAVCIPATAPEGWGFEPAHLQACLEQPAEWKQRYGFSEDIEQILMPGRESSDPGPSAGPGPPNWQRVILDRPERLLTVLLLVQRADGADSLHGYPVRQDGWAVQPQPAFTLASGWQEPFPELLDEPPLEQWRQAWRMWCQPRGLTATETDNCPLERIDHRLRVELSSRFIDKLRSARSDALKGEAWLLAGEGRVRTAAQLEIAPARPATAPPT
jgi:hypothetical protein